MVKQEIKVIIISNLDIIRSNENDNITSQNIIFCQC